MKKTNAMRILDSLDIDYIVHGYDVKDDKVDGVSVAEKIKKDPKQVYKTLLAQGSKGLYVFLVPVESELDFKKAAKLVGEKKIDLLPVNKLKRYTGYIRGGCSPIGMKKEYPTFIDKSVEDYRDAFIVSGGQIGSQIELSLDDLKKVIDIKISDIKK